jgi:hypothetical protein
MPKLDGRLLLERLKGAGGETFARFVDALIRGEAHAGGLPQSEIDTQIRVNIRDGGVDTAVHLVVPRDQIGYLSEKTCWQYKSETYGELVKQQSESHPLAFLSEAVQKPEVKRLIGAGYAFRFCFLGDITPEALAKWQAHLKKECEYINPTAAEPRIVAADKLTVWADRFPAVASMVSGLPAEVFILETWGPNARAMTSRYVPNGEWESTARLITSFVKAANPVERCLPIQGKAGVGKTRLVFECLANLPESESLVIYTTDDRSAQILSEKLATDTTLRAILVADECSLEARMKIEGNIAGCYDRVRFICLSNTEERGSSIAREIWLEEMRPEAVNQVLAQNFPDVPVERRHAYAELADRAELLEKLARFDPQRSVTMLLVSVLSEDYRAHDHALRALKSLARNYPEEVMESFGRAVLDADRRVRLLVGEITVGLLEALPAEIVVAWARRVGVDGARAIAAELPLPFVNKEGVAVVPEITLALLAEFGSDAEVSERFITYSLRGGAWWGNGGDYFRGKAEVARKFLSHENQCIRRWADLEVARSDAMAKEEQIRHEERML